MMKASELRTKKVAELQALELDLHKEQFNLRMQAGAENQAAQKNHLFKKARRNVARIKTVLKEKQLKGEA